MGNISQSMDSPPGSASRELETAVSIGEDRLRNLVGGVAPDVNFQIDQVPFLTLAEILPDGIYCKDFLGRFLWVNRSILNLMGVRHLSDVVGKTDFDFFSRQHALEARVDELQVLLSGQPILDKLEKDTDYTGKDRWAMVTRLVLKDSQGNLVGTYGTRKDVTDLKAAENALALESSLLKALMENIPDGDYFKDPDSRFVKVSRGIHLEGITRLEDAIGKTDFDFFTEDHARQAFNDEQELMRTGKPIVDKIEKETFPTRPDGWVSTTKVPIYDPAGNVAGLVGISRDVTERVKAEEAIRKAKEDLEVRVQERTSALVQEIKQHLRTEKALRDNEAELQLANNRLQARLDQLNFLNSSAQRWAQFMHRKELLPALVEAFAATRPGLEVALCELENGQAFWRAGTPSVSSTEARALCVALANQGSTGAQPDMERDWRDLKMVPEEKLESLPPACLHLPLMCEDKIMGIVLLFGDSAFAEKYVQDVVLLHTLAAQAAVSLNNANSIAANESRARLESELSVAQGIQKRFTPTDSPDIPGIRLKGIYHPAYEVGGDYLDYFRTPSGSWVLVIADVSGKGIPAALVMTMLRSTFHAEARNRNSAKDLLTAVNDLMLQDLDEMTFITASCCIIDPQGRSMSYARAGHPPLLYRHGGNGHQPEALNPRGMALGLVGTAPFGSLMEEVQMPLNPGDSFLLFTDGLVEAMDAERNTYGLPRLRELVSGRKNMPPEKLVLDIMADVKGFIKGQPYHDDLTMLALEVLS
jgi:PAS domain S-box-containing protein